MSFSHENRIVDATGIELGLISPDGKDGMLAHAEEFSKAGIPFIFDPGQQMPMFDAEELRFFVDRASWLTVNDYECELMKQRTGWSETEISNRLDALIVTKGEKGSTFYTGGSVIEIPPATVNATRDPTGCGDAYRAGLIYGLLEKSSWETTGRIASLMGAIKIESSGTQNHSFTLKEFRDRYRDNFGDVF